MYPSDYLYSRDHEWVRVEGDTCVLGITEYAQEELGEIVFVELPEVGQSFDATDEVGTIESVKAVAEVYTPVSGEVARGQRRAGGRARAGQRRPARRRLAGQAEDRLGRASSAS